MTTKMIAVVSALAAITPLTLWAFGMRQERQFAQRPAPSPPAVYFPQQSERTPPAVVIRAHVPESTQVCAELDDGYTACRSVREFRAWVRLRVDAKKE